MRRLWFEAVLVVISLAGLVALGYWTAWVGAARPDHLSAQLEREASIALLEMGAGWAEVRVEGQTAILTGAAPTEALKTEAASVVLKSTAPKLPGWVPAFIHFDLPAGGPLWGGVTKVDNRLTLEAAISPYTATIRLNEAEGLWIEGYVANAEARDAVIARAEALFPGRVAVQLDEAAGAPDADWTAALVAAIESLDGLTEATVVFADTRVEFQLPPPDAEGGGTAIAPVLPEGFEVAVMNEETIEEPGEVAADEEN